MGYGRRKGSLKPAQNDALSQAPGASCPELDEPGYNAGAGVGIVGEVLKTIASWATNPS